MMRLRNIAAPGQKRAQELAAGRAALLGVELRARNPPPPGHRREPVAVKLGRGQDGVVRGGLDEKRVEAIEGYADRKLKVPGDPEAAENRRIEILLREAST